MTDIVAPLPHDFESGGLRKLAGLMYRDVRESVLKDMYGLFDDDPRLGPSLQAQLFAYSGLGALAALPVSLAELLPNPYEFRVAGATAFMGMDALAELRAAGAEGVENDKVRDKFAMRLANSLSSHGPALLSTMLAPSYSLSKSLKNPALLDSLRTASGYMRVPQTPLNAVGACASSSIVFCEFAPQMVLDYPGYQRPTMVLWTAADAATRPSWQILDAFGPGALMTRGKLAAMNANRAPSEQRSVADSLAPFDIDANGTVVGEGGSGVLVTTLDFALRNFLDITSIIVGWGQSGEAGGKAHFAGVGFGGENALIHAFDLAHRGHGYGVADFQYLVAHATGTRTNSKTDLTTAANARTSAAERQGRKGALPAMTVGTPKSVGDGHTMGETGLKALSQARAVPARQDRRRHSDAAQSRSRPRTGGGILRARSAASRRQHRRRCGVCDAGFRRLQRCNRAARRTRRSVRALRGRSQSAVSVPGALARAASGARAAREILASAPPLDDRARADALLERIGVREESG